MLGRVFPKIAGRRGFAELVAMLGHDGNGPPMFCGVSLNGPKMRCV